MFTLLTYIIYLGFQAAAGKNNVNGRRKYMVEGGIRKEPVREKFGKFINLFYTKAILLQIRTKLP